LDRKGLSVSTETASRFQPRSPAGNSEICIVVLLRYPLSWAISPLIGGSPITTVMEDDMPEDLGAPWDGSVPVAATAVVKRIEGFAANPYEDNPGNPKSTWTIGYGSIHDAAGAPITADTPPINEADAEALLMNEMRGTAEEGRSRPQPNVGAVGQATAVHLGESSVASRPPCPSYRCCSDAAASSSFRDWAPRDCRSQEIRAAASRVSSRTVTTVRTARVRGRARASAPTLQGCAISAGSAMADAPNRNRKN
jgi:hypothetical protein